MRDLLSKRLSIVLLIAYAYLAVFSLFAMSEHHHVSVVDCPYMQGQLSLCAMDSFQHLTAWKSKILALPNTIYFLTILVLSFVAFSKISTSPPLLRQLLYYKKIKSEPIFYKLKHLFFRGILSPKPY